LKTVLLTAVGSASTAAALKSYRAAGYRVLGCDIYEKSCTVSAGEMDAFFRVPRAADEEAYVSALAGIVREEKVDYVIPSTDVEVDALCGRKAAFSALGAVLCCPDAPVAELCRDKLRMAQTLANAHACDVIPTYTAETLPSGLNFPLMVKPVHGRSSEGQTVVRSADELVFALRARADRVIQPLIPGEVYTADCARDAFGNAVVLARREKVRAANGLGIAVDICPASQLNAVCRRILECVGLVGVVNMEFIRNGDTYFFLEINPRFSGGMGFSVLAGYDFPLAMLACHAGEAIPAPPIFRPMAMAQRFEMRVTEG
jgi:carbamoyl-phosphate synthase large subunit